MQFIQSLSLIQESSALILPDLKKVMQKDKRVSPFLKRDSSFTDLEDPKASLETLKFYMLNNPNVISHVKSRTGVGKNGVSKWNLDTFRKSRTLEEKDFDNLKEVVQDIFKDHASLSRGTLSSDTMKQLRSWANHSGRYYNLSDSAQKELSTVEALHPTKPIVIYRGLLFKEYDFSGNTWDKSEPNGVKFAKAIRANKKEVDLSWDRPSSWSKSKQVAQRFAMYGPANSNFEATFQMLSRKGAIDGKVGYIVAMLVDPKDVLIDFQKAKATIGQFEDESEVIVKPGKYHCRIVKKFTPEGEVAIESDDSETKTALLQIEEVLKEISKMKTEELDVITNLGAERAWSTPDFMKLINANAFQKAAVNSTTTRVLHMHDELITAAKKIAPLMKKVSREVVASDEKLSEIYKMASSFISAVGKSAEAATAEEYRKTIKSYDLDFERAVMTRDSFFDKDEVSKFKKLGDHLKIDPPSKTHIHQTTKAKQSAYIDSVIRAFFKHIGVEAPEDTAERKASFINILKKAVRNHITAKMIKSAVASAGGSINKERNWFDDIKV